MERLHASDFDLSEGLLAERELDDWLDRFYYSSGNRLAYGTERIRRWVEHCLRIRREIRAAGPEPDERPERRLFAEHNLRVLKGSRRESIRRRR